MYDMKKTELEWSRGTNLVTVDFGSILALEAARTACLREEKTWT